MQTTFSLDLAFKFLLGLAGLVALLIPAVWIIWTTIKKAEDPARMIFKWILTGVIFVMLLYAGGMLQGGGWAAGFTVPIVAAAIGVALGIIWAPNLGALLAKGITGFYDGGDTEIEARPFYSIARAKQKRGLYDEAIARVEEQLQKFPHDFEGWMLLAEIHAKNKKDFPAAQACISEILLHGDHAPRNIAFALNRSADWHLSAGDREAAHSQLERIIAQFPGTELAHTAAQRISHLTTGEMLQHQKERPLLVVPRRDEYIGLKGEVADPRPRTEEPAETANRLVQQLNEHPEDVEARESLARVYADQYQRRDLAVDQLEQLIQSPGASQKETAKWLNMIADFHLQLDQNRSGAEEALRRILHLYPRTAVAAQAENRIARLETELRKARPNQALRLGTYDDRIGLKGGPPKKPAEL